MPAPARLDAPLETAAVLEDAPVLDHGIIDLAGLDALIGALAADDREVIGPVVRSGAVALGRIRSVADLPAGVGDEQEAGHYRLRERDDGALFGWAVGAHSWRAQLFPARSLLWEATRTDGTGAGADFAVTGGPEPAPRYAFVGVRSCDLHAIAISDRVFLGGDHPDPVYGERRHDVVMVAVHCSDPAATCFCTSMGTGPRAPGGYDLALTELLDGDRHELLVEAGTERGRALLAGLPHRPATEEDLAASAQVSEVAVERIERHGRRLDTDGIGALLTANPDHPRWDDVAERCLACTNCTLVCPTCFCSTVEDTTDLTGEHAQRWRRWDSCFTLEHSYLRGGTVRTGHRERYRQWLTHKLATWIDQLGSSGCVGCGRCVTWCPVGIDLTEEVAAIRAEPDARRAGVATEVAVRRAGGTEGAAP
jgi:sulfhydrogenase subunit beta (sulfur reductase)